MILPGANDATDPGDRQHVDISKYAENLHTIISLVTSPTSPYYSPETRVILITPPPVNLAQGPQFSNRNNVNTKAYASQAVRVAEEMNVPVVDVWSLFWKWGKGEETALAPLFTDGLHLTAEGYKVIVSNILLLLSPLMVNTYSLCLMSSWRLSASTSLTCYRRAWVPCSRRKC